MYYNVYICNVIMYHKKIEFTVYIKLFFVALLLCK